MATILPGISRLPSISAPRAPVGRNSCSWRWWGKSGRRRYKRAKRSGARDLAMRMGADAEPNSRGVKSREVRCLEIFLTQVHSIRAVLDGELPIVVDEESAPFLSGISDGIADFFFELFAPKVLDAQLRRGDTQWNEAPKPARLSTMG